MPIVSVPKSNLIEKTAVEFAAVYYEAGRTTKNPVTGKYLTSKHKDARSFARANFEKFIPKVVEHFLTMLGNEHLPTLMKQEIYEALLERHNDPTLQTESQLPDIDVKKLIELTRANQGSDATPANLDLIKKIEAAVKHKGH